MPVFSNQRPLPTFRRWWKLVLGFCPTRWWYKNSQCVDLRCCPVGQAVPATGLLRTHSHGRLVWLARHWRRGSQLSGARDRCQRCSRESFCDKERVFPKADFSLCWDELGYSRGSSCCCSHHRRGGGDPDGPEHPSFAKPFISGREPMAAAQTERRMRIASMQGHRHVWALGPLAAVEDFQQVLALWLVQALGLQL